MQFSNSTVWSRHWPPDTRYPLIHSKHATEVSSLQSLQWESEQRILQKGAEERVFPFPHDTLLFTEYKHYEA